MPNQDEHISDGAQTELWEIARYVEEHPEDYEERWRLAKKLYVSWEYRLALEHLQILKNDWQRKLNVIRYLSAAYYRLGRYDEAIAELKAAIETWPQEITVREQLARVLEVSGEEEEAARTWRKIKELDPKHPIAENAAKRLDAKQQPTATTDLHLGDSDSGIDLGAGQACRNCGAVNGEGFDRCWQCHAPLVPGGATPRPTPPMEEPKVPILTPETATLSAGIVVVGLLALSLYLSVRLLWIAGNGAETPQVIVSLGQLYAGQLGWTRVIVGALLILLCPAVLWGILQLIKPEEPVPSTLLILAGLLSSLLGYVCTWLPANLLFLALLLPAVISMAIIAGTFGLGLARAINVWILHLATMLALTVAILTLVEAVRLEHLYNPFTEIPAVLHFAGERFEEDELDAPTIPGSTLPLEQRLRWLSTGSSWLDYHARKVTFTLIASPASPDIWFELQDDISGTLVFERVADSPWTYSFEVDPDKAYRMLITGPKEEVTVRLKIATLFRMEMSGAPAEKSAGDDSPTAVSQNTAPVKP